MKNRLNLDFSLSTNTERLEFVSKYLEEDQFKTKPPTEAELETIANYLLYGKDPKTGKNVVQEKSIQIPTRHKTWDSGSPVDSLDELMESPGFNEAALNQAVLAPSKKVREIFSRSEARSQCPAYLKPTLENLFRRIDEVELQINYYELDRGKRKNPPREKLLNRFTPQEQIELETRARNWNQPTYLRSKHQLVELRREQYTLRDTFRATIFSHQSPIPPEEPEKFDFDTDTQIWPLGLANEKTSLVFRNKEKLFPAAYSEDELGTVSTYYWKMRERTVPSSPDVLVIDFRDESQVGLLFTKFFEAKEDITSDPAQFPGISQILNTLNYYIKYAELIPSQQELLDMKMRRVGNSEIAKYLNQKYGRAYTPNYISTIFRQQIIPKICQAAQDHEEVVGFLFFPEEFKTCTGCGRTLLINNDNFMHRTRSKDGFSNRCKRCDSRARKKGGTT